MKAGIGTAVIRPTPPVYLAGFGARTEPATSIHDDLEARALYLTEGDTTLCLVVCDLLGMTPDVSSPIREAMAAALGIPLANALVACTHTHQAPSLIAGTEALGWPTPEGFNDLVRDACVVAAKAARDNTRPSTLRYTTAPLPDGFAFNRRNEAYDEPTFSVLHAPSVGVVANIGIHPVLLGPNWFAVSTDWVGPFRTELERITGVPAIELTAALGDINPTPPEGKPGEAYEPWASAEQTADYGRRLAHVVADALEGAEPVAGELGSKRTEPGFPSTLLKVLRDEAIEVPVGGTAISALHAHPTMRVDLVEWSIGDVRLVSIPGEAFHLLGKEIATSRNDRVLLAGLSPSWHGYLPHPWGDGYEEGVSYGKECVAAIHDALLCVPSLKETK